MSSLTDLNLNKLLYRDASTPDANTVIDSNGKLSTTQSSSVGGSSDYTNSSSTDSVVTDNGSTTPPENNPETITSGEIAGDLIMLDGFIRSKNYVENILGWTINADGTSQLNNLTLVGGIFRYGKTSFSDTVNPGYIFDSNGIYIGSANDAVKLKLDLATGLMDLTGTINATDGTIGGFTITSTTLYGGIIQTSDTVGIGNSGVVMDTNGLRGYDSVLGETFNLPTDGSAPTFASGIINNTIFEINTNAVLRTSSTVGDGSVNSAGILINNTGLYACEASQALVDANVKILIDGSAVLKMNVKGGQTDYSTGIGYFLGLSGGDYKFSIGNPDANYMTWDGTYLRLKGSFDVGIGGLINNSVYTVANLPVQPTVVGFSVPSAYE